jgi:dTDP-glucose 4,6-dehydratase
MILQFLDGNLIRTGNLYTTRDLTFVEDTARGIILGGFAKGIDGQEINLGTGKEERMKDWLELIGRLVGKKNYKVESSAERTRSGKFELNRLCSDNSKARKLLKWKPEYTAEAGLRKTIEWFKAHRKEYGMPYYAEHK